MGLSRPLTHIGGKGNSKDNALLDIIFIVILAIWQMLNKSLLWESGNSRVITIYRLYLYRRIADMPQGKQVCVLSHSFPLWPFVTENYGPATAATATTTTKQGNL